MLSERCAFVFVCVLCHQADELERAMQDMSAQSVRESELLQVCCRVSAAGLMCSAQETGLD